MKRPKMREKATFFAFLERKNRKKTTEILLEQRPYNASLMAGMWELPQLEPEAADPSRLILSLRHSITTTNYQVGILGFASDEISLLPSRKARKWMKAEDLPRLPLTGLARKALKHLHILPGSTSLHAPPKVPRPASKLLFSERSVAE